jgi:hypothetical protein
MMTAKTSWRFQAATAALDGILAIEFPFKITADVDSLTSAPEIRSLHESCRASAYFGRPTLGKLIGKRKSKSMPGWHRYEVLFHSKHPELCCTNNAQRGG